MEFFFCIRSRPSLIACHRHEDCQYSLAILQGSHHMLSSSQQKQYRELSMGQTGNKHKTSLTGKVTDGRGTNTTIYRNLVTWYVDVPRSKSLSLQ